MPAKKNSSEAMSAPQKKKTTTRKKTVRTPESTTTVETTATTKTSTPYSTAPTTRPHKEHHGGRAVLLFLLLVLLAIGGVYAYQKQQTNSVVSKLSTLEQKLDQKMTDLEEGIDDAKETAEQEKIDAVADANTKTFSSVKYTYSFSYPKSFEVVSSITNAPGEDLLESVLLMKESDSSMMEGADAPGRYVSFQVYPNPDHLSPSAWLDATPAVKPSEDVIDYEGSSELEGFEIASVQWQEAGATMKLFAMPLGDNILVPSVSYGGPLDAAYDEEFMTMIDTLALE